MKQVDSKEAVESFLLKAHEILKDISFDIHKNFYLQRLRTSYSENNLYTNESTLFELNYDNQPGKTKPFYCFIKNINGKQVYIKFKISEVKNKQVFCVSFHFAEFNVKDEELPYKK